MSLPAVVVKDKDDELAEIIERLSTCSVIATTKQIKFVAAYLSAPYEIRGKIAWDAAGYPSIDHLSRDVQRMRIHRILCYKNVRDLLKLSFSKWALENRVNAGMLADKVLNIINTADNHRDQLSAIRLLADLGGFRK